MIRRYDLPPQRARHYRLRPGAYAILLRDGAMLLTHQSQPKPEYQLPGGGIERGEHPIPALHREVREETGWSMSLTRRLGAYRRFTYMPEYDLWAEKLCTVYLARPILQFGPPLEKDHRAIWTDPKAALDLLDNPGDRAFLTSLL